MTIAKVEEGLEGASLPKKKLDLPMTLDKDTLCTNIPSNITAMLERVWREGFYHKTKVDLPMTIYMENVFAFSLRVIPKCFVCGKREKGIRHFSLITPMHE